MLSRTTTLALAVAQAGDPILVTDGIYTVSNTIDVSVAGVTVCGESRQDTHSVENSRARFTNGSNQDPLAWDKFQKCYGTYHMNLNIGRMSEILKPLYIDYYPSYYVLNTCLKASNDHVNGLEFP